MNDDAYELVFFPQIPVVVARVDGRDVITGDFNLTRVVVMLRSLGDLSDLRERLQPAESESPGDLVEYVRSPVSDQLTAILFQRTGLLAKVDL